MALLDHDKKAHEVMAELEEIYYRQIPVDFKVLQEKYDFLSLTVSKIIECLSTVSSKPFSDLNGFYKKIDSYGRHLFYEAAPDFSPPLVLGLDDADAALPDLAGGKAAALSKISSAFDFAIPKGFVITTQAFNYFIHFNKLEHRIDKLLAKLDVASPHSLESTSNRLIEMMKNAAIPPEIESAVSDTMKKIWPDDGSRLHLAVRSSAVGEDDAVSFAGQYRSLINITRKNILGAWRRVIESKYAPRALNYRIQCGFLDIETPMAVLVLEMIDPLISGVMYTKTPNESRKNQISIHSVYGLGESLVDGRVTPETVFVETDGDLTISKIKSSEQTLKIEPSLKGGTRSVPVPADQIDKRLVDDDAALSLAETGMRLEAFFKVPQDIEWCMEKNRTITLLQSRPLQTHTIEDAEVLECSFDDVQDQCIASGGETACGGIATGVAKHVRGNKDLDGFPVGGVLLAPHASSDFAQIIDRISAVVTEKGSVAGHFASVAREFGVPFLVGVENAMQKIHHNMVVTVNAIEGTIFEGQVQALMDNPCAKARSFSDSPFMRRLSFLMSFVSPLELVDPEAENFNPTGCRSLHDIIRYSHETAINSMFQIGGNRWFKTGGIKKLDLHIPMKVNVLDVGGGLSDGVAGEKRISAHQISSRPMNAVLKGLTHPDIKWGTFSHFNWEEHDRMVMSGGIISPDNAMFASHAILAKDYANLNLKFGYHFVIVDALCGEGVQENQIRFRFSGGGAEMGKRMLRTRFLGRILSWLEFTVNIKHDLIDGVYVSDNAETAFKTLDMTGRLLGATRLMDMYLKTDEQIDPFVEDFKKGIYHYADEL